MVGEQRDPLVKSFWGRTTEDALRTLLQHTQESLSHVLGQDERFTSFTQHCADLNYYHVNYRAPTQQRYAVHWEDHPSYQGGQAYQGSTGHLPDLPYQGRLQD